MRSISSAFLAVVTVFTLLSGCSTKPDDAVTPPIPGPPVVRSIASVTNLGPRVILKGTVEPNGYRTTCYFDYGLTASYGSQPERRFIGDGWEPITLCDTVFSILLDATYHFRIVAQNSTGTVGSSDRTFSVIGSRDTNAPAIIIPSSLDGLANPTVGATSVRITASVHPHGRETRIYIEYGPTSDYGGRTSDLVVGSGNAFANVQTDLPGLSSGRSYHWRLVAYNAAGFGASVDTVMYVYGLPTLSATAPTGMGLPLVTLHGTVIPGERALSCHFEYGPTAVYGSSTAEIPIPPGTAPVSVSVNTPPLPRAATYHWRLVCSRPEFRVTTADSVFTTWPSAPLEFRLPLSVGTRWKYRYERDEPAGVIGVSLTRGSHVWEVAAGGTADSVPILVTRIDTVTTYTGDHVDENVTITQTQASFLVTIGTYFYSVRWSELMKSPPSYRDTLSHIPRYVESLSDTLTTEAIAVVRAEVKYMPGVGLVRMESSRASSPSQKERLILESLDIR